MASGRLLLAFLVAVALHLALFPLVPRFGDAEGAKKKGAQLVRVSKQSWEKNRRIKLDVREAPAAPPEEKKRDEKKEEDERVPPGQVVSLPPPEREERPDTADYASEYNQKVAHETKSRDQTQQVPVVARRLQRGKVGAPQAPTEAQTGPARFSSADAVPAGPEGPGRARSGVNGSDKTDGAGQRAMAFEIPQQAAQDPLKLKLALDGRFRNRDAIAEVPGNGTEARIAMGPQTDSARREGSGDGPDAQGQGTRGGGVGASGNPSLAELTPSLSQLERLMGAPANDHLPEVEVDAETRLNAWRWKHATFFNRVADAIRREWQGGDVLSHNDPSGHVYGFEDRMTVVQVRIDKKGNVLDVNVAEPSGALVLDDEAVRAFKQAGPFANPPPQLFGKDESFTFQFGFNVSYNRATFDLNWKPN